MLPKDINQKVFLIALGIILAAEIIYISITALSALPSLIVLGVVRIAEICLLVLLVVIWGKGISNIGLGKGTYVIGLKKGCIWSGIFGLAAVFFFSVLYAANLSPLQLIQTSLPGTGNELILYFLVGGLIAPIAEEIFFRGIVYGFLRKWGVLAALLGTTVLFVAAHFLSTGVAIPQVVGGVVFAIAYEVEDNLLVPITIHVLGNSAIFTLSLVGGLL